MSNLEYRQISQEEVELEATYGLFREIRKPSRLPNLSSSRRNHLSVKQGICMYIPPNEDMWSS